MRVVMDCEHGPLKACPPPTPPLQVSDGQLLAMSVNSSLYDPSACRWGVGWGDRGGCQGEGRHEGMQHLRARPYINVKWSALHGPQSPMPLCGLSCCATAMRGRRSDVHAEANAICSAAREGVKLQGWVGELSRA